MKVVQTRIQGLIFRLSESVPSVLLMLIMLVALAFLGRDLPKDFAGFYLAGLLVLPIGVTLWLAAFNSGKSKIDEYSLSIENGSIVFRGLTKSGFVMVSDFQDYEGNGVWPKTFRIKGREKNIEFSELVFSPSQILQIKEVLNELR
ncbi:hypothetical protein R50072_37790 [Simiduia litorea]|uniref:hypothetical protein n=1 Tax=Simiduia litorea TaxID=1435348 RepID=UPI0036F2AF0E